MEGGRPVHPAHHPHTHHPDMPPVQYAHLTPTSTHEGRPHPGAVEHFRWGGARPEGGTGGNGAQCSISCSREGLVMTYSALPGPPAHTSCPLCTTLATPRACPFSLPPPQEPQAAPVSQAAPEASASLSRSLCDLSRTQEPTAGRSLTFCGSLDRATPRMTPQRPYGRRCKSTAHIVLQNNEQAPRPHEFHATPAPARPQQEPRGRARQRTAHPPPQARAGLGGPGDSGGGWEQAEGVVPGRVVGPPSCPCHHCSTLYSLVSTLTCPCHHHHHTPCPGPQGGGRPATRSPTVRTFDSHTTYDGHPAPPSPRPPRRCSPPSPRRSPSPEKRSDAAGQPRPHTSPQAPRRVPRMGAAAATAAAAAATATPAGQEERGVVRERGGRHHGRHQQRQRPRTIHIDVYCSSSSDSETSAPSSPCVAEEEGGWRRPHAVVALGSKQHPKTELSLGRTLPDRTSSFVYSRQVEPQQQPESQPQPEPHPQPAPRTTFITDDDLPLCSSPPPPLSPDATPAAPRSHSATPALSRHSPIPMPAPPQRPTSLAVPRATVAQSSENGKGRSQSSLSYLSSPTTEGDPWGERELPESALSWRGSEFETSTPRPTSDMDLHSPVLASDFSLASLMEDPQAVQDSPKMWRSPQLERRRYIQKGQEDRYREALKRRTQQEQQQQQQQQQVHRASPGGMATLVQLPAFKEFSQGDLQVIAKSLEQRESEPSSGLDESFTLPQQKESFRPLSKESNRLLEWMRQYKEQEGRTSTRVREPRDSESLGYAESGKSLERTDSFGSMESKESLGTVERRKSFPGTTISHETQSPTGIRRGESLTDLEVREVLSRQEERGTGRRGSRPLEKKDSFRFQDKSQYYRAQAAGATHSPRPLQRAGYGRDERPDSGRLERRDSPRLERKDSRKLERTDSWRRERDDSWSKEKIDSGRLERRDSGRVGRSDSWKLGSDSGRVERTDSWKLDSDSGRVERSDSWKLGSDSGRVERSDSWRLGRSDSGRSGSASEGGRAAGDPERRIESVSSEGGGERGRWSGSEGGGRRASRALEQLLEREESSRSGSVEWQDVVSTVRRRLSSNAHPDPTSAPTAVPAPVSTAQPPQGVASPLPQRRWQGGVGVVGEEIRVEGGRHIQVGVFRQLARFPFSQTVPGPASRLLEARLEARTTCIPEQRRFVRPQLFGQMTLSYPRRRGIHFGPPRNPQCSCDNCRSWAEEGPSWSTPVPRLRAWSLSDLGSETNEGPGGSLPHHPGNPLSRTNSNVSDSATLSHVGSAATGGEQS